MSKSYATVNPCSMCMPMGMVLAFRGIEGGMPFFHGSQGCSTYMRLYLAHHFREPIDIASSALSEKGAVYGGSANLKQGLKNVIQGYSPRVIGVATTCLAETIGDDVSSIIREFQQEEPLASDLPIISVSTPSYAGSHEQGYSEALKSIVQALASDAQPNGRLNMIIGSVISPADVRYIKDMLDRWGCECVLMPDISETFDAPLTSDFPKIALGGTHLSEIKEMAGSKGTITIGGSILKPEAGQWLEDQFKIPHTALPLPIGLENADLLASKLEESTGLNMPERYETERGRLLDAMVDVHKLLANVRAAVYGDSEMVLGVSRLLSEVGVDPCLMATGLNSPAFAKEAGRICPGARALYGVDFSDIQREMAGLGVELMIGPSTGRQISKAEKIPLIRVGLPNHDRFGASRQLVVGYEGAMRILDVVANTLIESR
jgi:nitrogenase molybdenum-iron protein NifN